MEVDLFKKVEKYEFPFVSFFPENLRVEDVSERVDETKWDSLRFYVLLGDKLFRVKEFFLDWFYSGFPKSLMSDFVSTYSLVESDKVKERVFHYGKNYKGFDAISSTIFGTQIEIECSGEATKLEFAAILGDLTYSKEDFERVSNLTFKDRAYFTKKSASEWFEDTRISRMRWHNLMNRPNFRMANLDLSPSSTGRYTDKRCFDHRILVLEENNFEHVVWVDSIEIDSGVEYGYYKLRKREGLYNYFEENDGLFAYSEPYGPGMVQRVVDGRVYTISFSPGISLDQIEDITKRCHCLIKYADSLFDKP